MISEHVLRMHRYLQPGVEEGKSCGHTLPSAVANSCAPKSGTPAQDNLEQNLDVGVTSEETQVSTPVFEKYNALLHGGVTTTTGRGANKRKEVLSIAFIKKYIQYSKDRIKPVLTKGAADHIVSVYAALRNDDLASNTKRVSVVLFAQSITNANDLFGLTQTSPLTARTLETLIRLSTAHAKARLSKSVDERDALAAEEILRFALFKEVLKPVKHKKRKLNDGANAGDSDDSDDSEEDDTVAGGEKGKRMESPREARKSRATRSRTAGSVRPEEDQEDEVDKDAEAELARVEEAMGRSIDEEEVGASLAKKSAPPAIAPPR